MSEYKVKRWKEWSEALNTAAEDVLRGVPPPPNPKEQREQLEDLYGQISTLRLRIEELEKELEEADLRWKYEKDYRVSDRLELLKLENENRAMRIALRKKFPAKGALRLLPGEQSLWIVKESLTRDEIFRSVENEAKAVDADADSEYRINLSFPEIKEEIAQFGKSHAKRGSRFPRPGYWSKEVLLRVS